MAFIDQVQDLTSLTVSDNDELSQFLKDGVLDVTNRWLSIRPQDIELFGRESSETTSNASLNLNGARIISVIREDGTNNQWRNCRKISPALQYDVTDVDSLNYASKINPAYMIGDTGKISVFPTPGSDPNAFKAYYVNKDPVNSSGSALIHSHDDILYFPIDKVYLVVIYAGMKLLQANMGATTITDLSVTAVPPDAPSAPSFTVTTITEDTVSAGSVASVTVGTSTSVATVAIAAPSVHSNTVPSYADQSIPVARGSFNDYWVISDFPDSDPGELSVTAVPPDTPDVPELTGVGTAPAYTKPSLSNDVQSAITTFIDTDEDVELAQAKIQQFQASLAEYQADIQNELNEFNKENVEFQATIQREVQEDTLIIQKYQADLAVYQAEVGSQVQEYTQKLQRYTTELGTVFQAWQKTESDNLQLFQIEIQNELNNFNEANAVYQAALKEEAQNLQVAAGRVQQQAQIEIQEVLKQADVDMTDAQKEADLNLQASIQNTANALKADIESNAKTLEKDIQEYANTLGKYGAEIQAYQAEVGTQIQEYTQNLQADGMGYQWLQDQYAKLKAEYDTAFMIAAPKQQPQQQVRA